jgi:uncharacterized protein with HEPN domain
VTSPGDRKELHWLEDINEAIAKIENHDQRQRGKEALETDEHYRVWVFYHIERIGECASQLRRDLDYDNKYPEIDWKGAQAMRRHLVHRYWNADKDEVWKGVLYLPKIKEKVDELIKEKRLELDKDKENPRPKPPDVF